ncbi:hypothetical protein DUNSADRAFT_7019, partial [Dunaliella salina]
AAASSDAEGADATGDLLAQILGSPSGSLSPSGSRGSTGGSSEVARSKQAPAAAGADGGSSRSSDGLAAPATSKEEGFDPGAWLAGRVGSGEGGSDGGSSGLWVQLLQAPQGLRERVAGLLLQGQQGEQQQQQQPSLPWQLPSSLSLPRAPTLPEVPRLPSREEVV